MIIIIVNILNSSSHISHIKNKLSKCVAIILNGRPFFEKNMFIRFLLFIYLLKYAKYTNSINKIHITQLHATRKEL